jgi:hypothetical protein
MFSAVACAMHLEHACRCPFHRGLTRRHAAHLPAPAPHRPDEFGIAGLAQSPAERRHHLAVEPKVLSSSRPRQHEHPKRERTTRAPRQPLPPPRILAVRAWIVVAESELEIAHDYTPHHVTQHDDIIVHQVEPLRLLARHSVRIAPSPVHAADVDPRIGYPVRPNLGLTGAGGASNRDVGHDARRSLAPRRRDA